MIVIFEAVFHFPLAEVRAMSLREVRMWHSNVYRLMRPSDQGAAK